MSQINCPSCKSPNEKDSNFCDQCGTSLPALENEIKKQEKEEERKKAKSVKEEKYRTFWPRAAATFLDVGGLAPILWIDKFVWNSTSSVSLLSLWCTSQILLSLLYTVGIMAKFGASPGKIACGLRIVDLNESPITLRHAVLRNIVGIIIGIVLFLIQIHNIFVGNLTNRGAGGARAMMWGAGIMMSWTFLEFITMLTNKHRRAIHDFIAETVVIKDPNIKQAWLLWALVTLYILNWIVPRFITETNIVLSFK